MRVLVAGGVEFVVIGGLAVTVHGYERFTADLDLVPEPAPENLDRLLTTLAQIVESEEGGLSPTSLEGPHRVVETSLGRVHVVRDVKGLPAYEELSSRAIKVEFAGEVTVRVCGRDDLIAMKRAAGRPRDALDVLYLTEGDKATEADQPSDA
jgi:predicted nucleotidyltransferase